MSLKIDPRKLKELRKAHNFTQDYVADALGTVRQAYSHYETGRRALNPDAYYKLAKLYNISVDDLMNYLMIPSSDDNSDNSDNDLNDLDDSVSSTSTVHLPTNQASNTYEITPEEIDNSVEDFVEFYTLPINQKKYRMLNSVEKELLFYFDKLSPDDKQEVVEIVKIKMKKYLR